ncbi:MAG TPA: hypothetical protein VJC05_00230 [Candidatus Andersenbacteria bacterium]|nr:hypothetical protein [Candidatus Andersenbacteria bacterium]
MRLLLALMQYVATSAILSQRSLGHYLRRLLRSVAWFLTAAICGAITLGFALASLFFQLADLTHLVKPALVTAAIGVLVTAVLIIRALSVIEQK